MKYKLGWRDCSLKIVLTEATKALKIDVVEENFALFKISVYAIEYDVCMILNT